MSAEVACFNFHGHSVRTVEINGEPYLIARDVCAALAIANARDAVSRLDPDGVGNADIIDALGRPQTASAVNEAALYELIFQSRVPKAREFKRWVTREVLPAIRKTGSYGTPREMSRLELIEIARDAELERIAEKERRELAEAKVAELEPAAAVAQAFINAAGDFSVREAAQVLCRDHHIKTSQPRLFATLKALGWISDAQHAYQRHIDLGRVVVATGTFYHPRTGEPTVWRQIRITPKGIADLHKVLGQRHLRPVPA